jgi:hypothetical protein
MTLSTPRTPATIVAPSATCPRTSPDGGGLAAGSLLRAFVDNGATGVLGDAEERSEGLVVA